MSCLAVDTKLPGRCPHHALPGKGGSETTHLCPPVSHARCFIQAGSCSPSSLGIHENDSMRYTELLAAQMKGFVPSTAKAIAWEINLRQVLCVWNLCAEHTVRGGPGHGLGKFHIIIGVEPDPLWLSALPGLLSSQPLVQSKAIHSRCCLLFS